MSDRLPALPSGLIVRYVRGGHVEVECPGCGASDEVPPDPVADLMSAIEAFIDAHAVCWWPAGPPANAPGCS